jgi:hypothetical protein
MTDVAQICVHMYICTTFFKSTSNVLILTKSGLGYSLGDLFTNSSGHPDRPPTMNDSDKPEMDLSACLLVGWLVGRL